MTGRFEHGQMVMHNLICGSEIDWAATGTMLQGLGTVAGAGAVVWAANKGANTFEAWRKQKLAERRQAQAERILTATYKARLALNDVRSEIIWQHEKNAVEKGFQGDPWWPPKSETWKKRLVTAQVILNRIDRAKNEREALDQCLPMARALFGENLEQTIEGLNRQFRSVQIAANDFIGDEQGVDKDFTQKIYREMFAVKPADGKVNEATQAMDKAVAVIEKTCLPVLRLEQ